MAGLRGLRLIRGCLAALMVCWGAQAATPAGTESPPATGGNPPAAASGRASSTPPAKNARAALPISPDSVVQHISHTIAWYRRMGALQQLPVDADDLLPRDRLSKTALTAVQLAFDFGRAAAALTITAPNSAASAGTGTATPTATPAGTGSTAPSGTGTAMPAGTGTNAAASPPKDAQDAQGTAGELDRAAVWLADRITALQSQLADLDQQIAHAAPKDKQTLTARRAELAAALDLSKEVQGTVAQIERFEESADSSGEGAAGGLAAQIADLQRSVPEARRSGGSHADSAGTGSGAGSGDGSSSGAKAPAPAAATPPPSSSNFRPESAGVITLIGKWFSLEGSRRQLADAMKQSETLAKEIDGLRSAVSQDARALARQDLTTASTDPTQLAQAKQQLDTAAIRFKQLSTLLVPIGEEGITVEGARNTIAEWRDSLAARNSAVARFLLLRLGILLGSVAVVLFISEIWRRATFRYLHDSRRRQQFLALRRVAIGAALTLVIVFGLVSEVGSLATYAGLITAGLAVALQNVILAVVAYFFLIGRYGVRVGDRITLAGVTGRVVEIGLVRIYLMELAGAELRSSGRMVVLSNAVLFQPTALFKQMPGSDFYWHTVSMTLAATADISLAEKHLSEAAESVYEKYRPAIERQHAALQRFIDFETAMPRPEVFVRLIGKGLECTVRYPVEPMHSAATDQKMLIALRDALSKVPELQLVDGPNLDDSER